MTTTCTESDISCLPPVKRGDTWRIQFTWTDANGNPKVLTGATINVQLRNHRSGALVAEVDTIELASEDGVVTAIFLPATTRTVPPGTYYTDMEVAFSADDVLSSGTLALPVVADQTR